MVRFMFTTVMFASYQKNILDMTVCLLSSCSASGLLLSCLYVFCFSSSLLLFDFLFDTVILSRQGSLLFAKCVPIPTWHKQKRSTSQLTSPIIPTDFSLLGSAYYFFTAFSWLFLMSIDQSGWAPTRNTNTLPYSYAHTEPKSIYVYVCVYHSVHVLILSGMYIHVYTCVHVHTYVVFICTYVCRCIKLWNLKLQDHRNNPRLKTSRCVIWQLEP